MINHRAEHALQSDPTESSDTDTENLADGFIPGMDWEVIHTSTTYNAYAKELECMWHWLIVLNGEIVQEGCSLSLDSTRRAVGHVLAFYSMTQNHVDNVVLKSGTQGSSEGV